MVLIFIK